MAEIDLVCVCIADIFIWEYSTAKGSENSTDAKTSYSLPGRLLKNWRVFSVNALVKTSPETLFCGLEAFVLFP